MFLNVVRGSRALLLGLFCIALCSACAHSPPSNPDNLCLIFKDNPSWHRAAVKSAKRWGGPIHVPMAIMYQESGYRSKAKPPMQYFLWIIPTGRASNAYGYSQALKSTWAEYQRSVGSSFRSRSNFANSYDFIQWYMNKTYKTNKVSKWDAYAQYLNYHEGQGGYARGTYRKKRWLTGVAKKVDARARRYSAQYQKCKAHLSKGGFFNWF